MSAEVIPAAVFRVLRATHEFGCSKPTEPCEVVILPVVRIERHAEPKPQTRRKRK